MGGEKEGLGQGVAEEKKVQFVIVALGREISPWMEEEEQEEEGKEDDKEVWVLLIGRRTNAETLLKTLESSMLLSQGRRLVWPVPHMRTSIAGS